MFITRDLFTLDLIEDRRIAKSDAVYQSFNLAGTQTLDKTQISLI